MATRDEWHTPDQSQKAYDLSKAGAGVPMWDESIKMRHRSRPSDYRSLHGWPTCRA